MRMHFRNVHRDLCNAQLGSPDYGIPDKKIYHKMPADIADLGLMAHEYHFVVSRCGNHLQKDSKIDWGNQNTNTIVQQRYKNDPERSLRVHNFARQLILRWFNDGRGKERLDDIGGHIPVTFRRHSMFAFSIDRIDDSKPHTLDNVQVSTLALQGSFGVSFAKWKQQTVETLRRLVIESTSLSDEHLHAHVADILNHNKGEKSAFRSMLYSSRYHASSRKLTVDMTEDDLRLKFHQQKGRCAISGLMLTDRRTTSRLCRMSLDRIDSTKGYVVGNIRFVSKALNITDLVRKRTYKDSKDEDTNWTRDMFMRYIGLKH